MMNGNISLGCFLGVCCPPASLKPSRHTCKFRECIPQAWHIIQEKGREQPIANILKHTGYITQAHNNVWAEHIVSGGLQEIRGAAEPSVILCKFKAFTPCCFKQNKANQSNFGYKQSSEASRACQRRGVASCKSMLEALSPYCFLPGAKTSKSSSLSCLAFKPESQISKKLSLHSPPEKLS